MTGMQTNQTVIKKAWKNLQLRINVLGNNGGGHIENLLD